MTHYPARQSLPRYGVNRHPSRVYVSIPHPRTIPHDRTSVAQSGLVTIACFVLFGLFLLGIAYLG